MKNKKNTRFHSNTATHRSIRGNPHVGFAAARESGGQCPRLY